MKNDDPVDKGPTEPSLVSGGRLRALAGNAALLLVSVAITAVVLEIAVRIALPQQLIVRSPELYVPVAGTGYRFKQNLDATVNTGEGPARVKTDQAGFRVGDSVQAEPQQRVLLIGDSFMAALQVDHEQTLAGLMEADLTKTLARPVRVVNAGVPGWNPTEYRNFLRAELARERFDLVVIAVYLGNDIVRQDLGDIAPFDAYPQSGLRLPRALAMSELVDALARPINDLLEMNSHLFVLVKNRLGVLRMRLGLSPLYFPDGFKVDERALPLWDVTTGLLDEAGQAARARDIPVLFVLLPADFQVEPDIFRQYVVGFDIDSTSVDLEQPNRIVRERMVERGYPVIDVLPALRAAAQAGQRAYGNVDIHFNPAGHQLVWNAVRDDVVAQLRK